MDPAWALSHIAESLPLHVETQQVCPCCSVIPPPTAMLALPGAPSHALWVPSQMHLSPLLHVAGSVLQHRGVHIRYTAQPTRVKGLRSL